MVEDAEAELAVAVEAAATAAAATAAAAGAARQRIAGLATVSPGFWTPKSAGPKRCRVGRSDRVDHLFGCCVQASVKQRAQRPSDSSEYSDVSSAANVRMPGLANAAKEMANPSNPPACHLFGPAITVQSPRCRVRGGSPRLT